MTPEAQRIAIAELFGPRLFVLRKPIHAPFSYYRPNAHGYTNNEAEAWKVTEDVARRYISGRPTDIDRVVMEPAQLPDINDLNVIHEVEKMLTDANSQRYYDTLLAIQRRQFGVVTDRPFQMIHATAAQRAEAFLRTLNLWKDDV